MPQARDVVCPTNEPPGREHAFLGTEAPNSEKGDPAEARDPAEVSLPLGLALGSPIFPSGCEGKLGVALESLQGLRDLT